MVLRNGLLVALALFALPVAAAEVGALGRIVPQDKVIALIGTPGTEVAEVLVAPQQQVEAGQALMRLANAAALQAQYELADLAVERAEQMGPEQVDLAEAQLQLRSEQLERAKERLASYQGLATGARSELELGQRQQAVVEARHAQRVAKVELTKARKESQLALREAQHQRELAKAKLQAATLSAPRKGTILEINKQPGESLGDVPAILMADLSRMYVLCEVYESDLLKLKPGMPVSVSSNSLPEDISGSVARIDPIVETTSRLGTVLVELEHNPWAAQLIGMEVNVVIHP